MRREKRSPLVGVRDFGQMLGIYRKIRTPWLLLLLTLALGLTHTAINARIPKATADILNADGLDRRALIIFALCTILTMLLKAGKQYLEFYAYELINRRTRGLMWIKIMHISMRNYEKEDAAHYISRITADADSAYTPISTVLNMVDSAYALVVYCVNMYHFNRVMARYVLLVLPFAILLSALMGKFRFKASRRVQTANADVLRYLTEHTKNLRLVKASGTEAKERENGKAHFTRQWKARMYGEIIAIICIPLGLLITNSSSVISFGFGGYYVSQGWMKAGDVIAFYQYAGLVVTQAWIVLYMSPLAIRGSQGILAKIAEVLHMQDEETIAAKAGEPEQTTGIALDHVSFAYDPQRPILRDVSCSFPKGSTTAILGPNGGGKSTILRLLERFYLPEGGRITAEGKDIQSIDVHQWRKQIGYVSQSCELVDGTIRENMIYGLEKAPDEETLIRAAKLANAYSFISRFPDGFDTDVGEGGSSLSGGECQRVCIARMFLRDPRYLLLDEATSALDAESEKAVLDALKNLMQGRTTIMIAHSPSAAAIADRVVRLEGGRVLAESAIADIDLNELWKEYDTGEL